MIASARKNLGIGLHVIIRPRGGDFLYTEEEYDIMRRDIEICGKAGIDGVVIGLLREDGSIDIDRTARLIEDARPMSVTFHRAFDMCSDAMQGLDDVICTGADRLLTSGLKNSAVDGAETIRQLVARAGSSIIIMPGGGLNEGNIDMMAEATGAKEFHLTGRKTIYSKMIFRREDIFMGGIAGIPEYSRKTADSEMIKRIISILKMA